MNYKVMQRPMFKLGGKAASQGTGITSGLDEKVNYSIGGGVIQGQNMGAREGFQDPSFGNMSLEELINMKQKNYNSQMSGLSDMRDIVKLNALGQLVGNVLPNVERGGLKGITDFFRDPGTTQAALQGLTGLKKVDLQEKKLKGAGLDSYIKDRIGLETIKRGDEKFEFEKKKYEDLYGIKLDEIEIKRQALNKETDRELRERFGREADALVADYGSPEQMPANIFTEYERKSKIALGTGFKTKAEAKIAALQAVSRFADPESIGFKKFNELVEQYASSIYYGTSIDTKANKAQGGRVERQMGSPMMGEQSMTQAPQMMAQQDAAMETQQGGGQDSGNQVYAMLRSRLPQEISDEVVQLISYNKEAFADFASIKNQEDVSSFNDKYGVQLVIDVATV